MCEYNGKDVKDCEKCSIVLPPQEWIAERFSKYETEIVGEWISYRYRKNLDNPINKYTMPTFYKHNATYYKIKDPLWNSTAVRVNGKFENSPHFGKKVRQAELSF